MNNDNINTPRRIDTDLTAAYLRAVQQEIETADKTIADLLAREHDWASLDKDLYLKDKEIESLKAEIEQLVVNRDYYKVTNQELVNELTNQKSAYAELLEENTTIKNQSPSAEWHPATETPINDERVIVRTDEGLTFMFESCNGKWPKWVEKWMYIPQ